MHPRLFAFVLLLLPFAEIAGFIAVGQWIGLWATLALIIASSIAGLLLLRRQGIGLLRRMQAGNFAEGEPGRDLVRATLTMIAGLLLAVPGFITSLFGLLLLLPFTQSFFWRLLKPNIVVGTSTRFYRSSGSGPSRPDGGASVIDLEAEEFSRDETPRDGDNHSKRSPWSDRQLPD